MTWATASDRLKIYYEDSGDNLPVISLQSSIMGLHDIWKYQVGGLKQWYR